jgi:hypothetical protein
VKVEVDAETYKILFIIATTAGQTPEGLLKCLADQYKQANFIERQIVTGFIRGRIQ